ncbi:hypothetical protein KC333_g1576 [Hortaea werneckii]|nr:hypothetical protein KC333_g1576 [Hortaea werneckii]KAI7322579.1 hypothetical protein KC326_g1828 [Hortaea werneckii]
MTGNSTHLCGGEAPASTPDSPQPVVATPPKRVNLPLPRELRDQIYGYLLHHEFTEHSKYPESGRRDAGLPSSYKFHTSILAVNTEIGEEATEVLRSNDFVQVTMNWDVDEELKAIEAPIVCDLARRKAHFDHLRIDYKLHVKSLNILRSQERKFVVVRLGLIKLLRVLQLGLLGCPSVVPVVLYGTGSKDNRRLHVKKALDNYSEYNSSINVHDNVVKPLSTATKTHLLEPFRNLIIGGQSVELNKMLPKHVLATFKLFVAPPVMNSLPMMWRLFELAQGMRAVADRHVLNGCFTKALRLYQHILFAHSDVLFRMERAKTVPGVLCVLLLVDTYLCHAAVELSTPESWPGYAGRWLGYAKALLEGNTDCYQAFFPAFELGAPRQMAIEWLDMLCRLSTIQNAGLQATIRSILEPMKDFRAIMASNNREQVADYFDHDVNYLKTLVPEGDDTAVIPIIDESKLSLFQLPPLILDFALPGEWSKPTDLHGFLDTELYELLLSGGLVSPP